MTASDFRAAIQSRVATAQLDVDASLVAACADYLQLLATWNRRINLTSLRLEPPTPDAAIDRLIIEPLLAAGWLDPRARWLDLGSGGGSPAIPLKLARPDSELTLVESRERKCAFLREAIRSLRITSAQVLQTRFEALDLPDGVSDAVTVRAVRMDAPLLDLVWGLLRRQGALIVFGAVPRDSRFVHADAIRLGEGTEAAIHLLRKD